MPKLGIVRPIQRSQHRLRSRLEFQHCYLLFIGLHLSYSVLFYFIVLRRCYYLFYFGPKHPEGLKTNTLTALKKKKKACLFSRAFRSRAAKADKLSSSRQRESTTGLCPS